MADPGQWSLDRIVVDERLDHFPIGDGWMERPVAGLFTVGSQDHPDRVRRSRRGLVRLIPGPGSRAGSPATSRA